MDHGEWPANSFEHDVAEVAGVRARVVSLSSLKADKAMARDDERVCGEGRRGLRDARAASRLAPGLLWGLE